MSIHTSRFQIGRFFHLSLQAFGLSCTLVACSAEKDDSFGEVQFALADSSRGSDYELVNAVFEIDGVTAVTLSSEDDTGESLSATLPVGDYTAELLDGWRLLELGAEGETEVEASLLSENPTSFSISPDETTVVRFVFETSDGTISFGEGTLDLGIEVEKRVSREVVFSEVMKNPVQLADTDGEWLELTNTGIEDVSLLGCMLSRDTSSIEISEALTVAPGQSVTLANSDAPGFTPDYVYSSLSLPNTAMMTLELVCGDELLDRVTIDPALTANAAGASLNLDPAFLSAAENDAPSSWCNAVESYNADLGTPGSPNTSCPTPQ